MRFVETRRPFALLAITLGAAVVAPTGARAQTASLAGSVLTDSTELPVAGAEVAIPALKLSVRSDAAGKYRLTGIRAGQYTVTVRLVGYNSFSADMKFFAGEMRGADFLLVPGTTQLAAVDVKATKSPRLAEFEERRGKGGAGRYLTADVFEKNSGSAVTDILLGRIAGIRRVNVKGTMVRPLAGRTGTRYNCILQVVLNGLVVQNGITNAGQDVGYFDIDRLISTPDVIGVEYYTVASTPQKYAGTGAECGTVVIWTK